MKKSFQGLPKYEFGGQPRVLEFFVGISTDGFANVKKHLE
jgi:hypothetical protein